MITGIGACQPAGQLLAVGLAAFAAGCGGEGKRTDSAPPTPAARSVRLVSPGTVSSRMRAAIVALRRQLHAPGARLVLLRGPQNAVDALVGAASSPDEQQQVYLVLLRGHVDFRKAIAPSRAGRRVRGRLGYGVYDPTSTEQLELGVLPRAPLGLP